MVKIYTKLLLVSFYFLSFGAFAEGTKDLRPTNSDFGFLNPWDWGGEFATYNAPASRRLYVHIADHTKEKIYLGFKAQVNPAYFRVKRPDGTIIQNAVQIPNTNGSAGYIDSYAQAAAGPKKFNPAGYTAVVVDPDVNGDYYIELNQGDPNVKASPPSGNGGYRYPFFDITVADTTTSTIKEGRLWARLWALSTGNQNQNYKARMYVLRDDSIRFEVNYNGIDPFGFGIISNSYGIKNTGDYLEDRKSTSQPKYTQGTVPYLPQHKIFLNPPDVNIYPFPTVTPVLNVNASTDDLITGCISTGYCINIQATKPGQTEVKLDLDNTPGYQAGGRDRIVYGRVGQGVNCVFWDGRDGIGDTAFSANIEINYKYEAGLIHIPIYDAENHSAGYIFSLMQPNGQQDTLKLYWDDSNFNTGTGGVNLAGCTVPCRNWILNYGDERFLNTWSFAYDQTLVLSNIQFEFCPPEVLNDTVIADQGKPTTIRPLLNDKAPLNQFDPASFMITCGPNFGTVSINTNNQIIYTSNSSYIGPDSICYRVCDTANPASCDTARIYIDVQDINQPPAGGTVNNQPVTNKTSATLTTPEDQSLDICIQWIEFEGEDIIATSLLNSPSHGTVSNFADGDSCFTYLPSANYNGPDTILVLMCDDVTPPACDTLFIPINVTPVNDPPLILTGNGIAMVNDTIKTITLNEDTPKQICLSGSDIDVGDLGDVTIVNIAPANGSVSGTATGNKCFTYTPNLNYNGPDTLTVSYCDNGTPQLCDQVTIVLNVLPVNDPPVAQNDTLFLDPGDSECVAILNNDSDIETPRANLTFTISGTPKNGMATISGDSICYTPNASYTLGLDSVTYTVCDNGSPVLCAQAVLIISIPKSQVPPFAIDDAATTPEDVAITIGFLNNDFDPNLDPITPTLLNGPLNGSANISGKNVIYTPNPNFNGKDSIQYYICDNATPTPLCDTAWIRINVTPVSDAPFVDDGTGNPLDRTSFTINEDTPITICFNVNDPDGGQQVDITQVTSFENLGQSTGLGDNDTCFTYTPNPNVNGIDSVIVFVCDDETPANCSQVVVVITINPVNDPPVALNDTVSTGENTAVNIAPLANDNDVADLSPLDVGSLQIVTMPMNGTTVVNANGSVDYTPNLNFSGRDSIQYQICDQGLPLPALCTTAWIYIDVDPINDPPVAVDDIRITGLGVAATIDVLANDSDPENDNLTATLLSQPFNGSVVSFTAGVLVYRPNAGFCGKDSLQYQLCDDGSPVLCDTAWVYISVVPSDQDQDSLADAYETLTRDTDKDGVPDYLDPDSDNDGIPDWVEASPLGGDICNPLAYDFDGDGVPDYRDPDSDNDGIPDWAERSLNITPPSGRDSDGDGIDDAFDTPNGEFELNPYDRDGDGNPDFRDLDSDNDGIPDWIEGAVDWKAPTGVDSDGDGIDDAWDPDISGNTGLYGIPVDTNGDGVPDFRDLDSDGDGLPDSDEKGPLGNNPQDSDGDGIPDFRDTDSDNDGISDGSEGAEDCDDDGIPNYLDPDACIPDIPSGFSPNGDGVNDYFVIPGLEDPSAYPNNSLMIFNRWGGKVYELQPYNNTWGGQTNVKNVFGGEEFLPTGTYFYIFDLGIGTKPVTGYIHLKR